MKSKYLIITILVLLVSAMFSGCQPAAEEPQTVTIKAGYLSGPTAFTMLKMAKDQQTLVENVNVEYEMVPSTDVIAGKLVAEEFDFAVIATNQAAMLYNNDVPYQIAASSVWGLLYLMGSEPITDVADLAGQEIALIGRGLTPDIMLRYALTENGLDPDKDVTLKYLSSPQELLQSMIAGTYKLAVMPEPLATAVTLQNSEVSALLDFQDIWQEQTGQDSYPIDCIVVRKEFAETYPEQTALFLEAYEASINWSNENLAEAGQYAEALETGFKAALVTKAIPSCNLLYSDIDESKDAIDLFLETLYNISPDVVGGKLPDEGFYYQK